MISRSRFERLRLTVHKSEGVVTPEDLQSSYEASYREGILPFEIWDFSGSTSDGLDIQSLGSLLVDVFPSGEEEERTAFVVRGEAQEELAGLFKRMAEFQEFPPEIRVFQDLTSAIHWLFGAEWQMAMDQITKSSDEHTNPT